MDIVIRAAIVYVFVYLVLRALGKRELGELTAFELVLLFIVGDLVQQSITQDDKSITAAILAISTIAIFIVVQSYLAFRFRPVQSVLDGEPVVVVHHGEFVLPAIRRQRMTTDEIKQSARSEGIADVADIELAILETDGKLSFITEDHRRLPKDEHRFD
jgi:uncharacterized membrane protein YcaP (DUF421 family)